MCKYAIIGINIKKREKSDGFKQQTAGSKQTFQNRT